MQTVLNTFSIVARCPRTGHLGIAMASAVPDSGPVGLHVAPGIGAIAAQGLADSDLASQALQYLAKGVSADQALELLKRDPDRDLRQWGIVDSSGKASAFTGRACEGWAGHIIGDGFTVQGNLLVGRHVIEAMASTASRLAGHNLANRLLSALEKGQEAGGDKRGKRSASLVVFGDAAEPLIDIQIGDDRAPIAELRRRLDHRGKSSDGLQRIAMALVGRGNAMLAGV